MSIEAIAWAFRQNIKPSSLKFVLVAMADCCREERLCWPSIERLESITSQNRKTIMQSIDKLEEMGVLRHTGQKAGKTGKIKVYEFNICNSTENGTVTEKDICDNDLSIEEADLSTDKPSESSNSTVFTSKQYRKRYCNPGTEPASCNKNKKAGGRGDFCELWEAEVLPYEWQDHAEKMQIRDDRLFRSWRKFKEISDWPLEFKRWKAWLERECGANS